MTDTNGSDIKPGRTPDDQGVLANLPRTRPQRSTARRVAARNARGNGASAAPRPRPERRLHSAGEAAGTPGEPQRVTAGSERPGARTRSPIPAGAEARTKPVPRRSARASGASRKPAPAQGFEGDTDPAGRSIQPPGAAELLTAAAEIVGELAKASLTLGERVLKDIAGRLPLS